VKGCCISTKILISKALKFENYNYLFTQAEAELSRLSTTSNDKMQDVAIVEIMNVDVSSKFDQRIDN
jgi:hypothetical protein